jgi:hypothetical protein
VIHIVFNEQDVPVLQEAMQMDDALNGKIVCLQDDYSVGPVYDLYNASGRNERKLWWQEVHDTTTNTETEDEPTKDDYDSVAGISGTLSRNEEEVAWIWAAQNSRDVSGYYWLLHYLKPFAGRVFILYLNNLPFINEKGGIFYPVALHEIPAKEFLKAKKLARPITLSEFEVDPDEWIKLSGEHKMVRLLEGGKKLIQQDASFFDAELKKFITADFQKATKVLNAFQSKSKYHIGNEFLIWRIRIMAAMDLLELQGKSNALKDVEVKLKTQAN